MNIEQKFKDLQSSCRHEKVRKLNEVELYRFLGEEDKKISKIFLSSDDLQECTQCCKIVNAEQLKKNIPNFENICEELLRKPTDNKIVLAVGNNTTKIKDNTFFQNSQKPSTPEEASFQVQEPTINMDTVFLNPSTLIRIEEAQIKIKFHKLFYIDYNFEKIKPYGSGTVLNFYGPPGTGKTKTAQAFAQASGLKFLDVNIADLESRYMSQTGKNIIKAFETATEENALIFFDEADTVLGKRLSDVKGGIDAEINMSRSVMLKELERFKGICIFATNFQSNIDIAFLRRIAYHIEFGLPEIDTLKKLWNYIFETIKREEPITEESLETLIDKLADASDGLSGADIITAVELTFPKSVIDEADNSKKVLFKTHALLESIEQVKSVAVSNQRADSTTFTKNIFGLD